MADLIEFSYEHIPTVLAFSKDDRMNRVLIGPVGSAKSSGCVMEMIYRSTHQKPGRDGVRRSRWAVVRNCYDEQTEILTELRGFQLFKNLRPDDRVAVLVDGFIEYRQPDKVYCAPYSGEMIGFEGENANFLVTPDHKMYVSKRRTRKKVWGEFEPFTAEEIYGNSNFRVRRDANWSGMETGLSSDIYEWIGYWYAEGSVGNYWNTGKTKQYPRCVITTKNNIKYTRDLFKRAGIKFSEWNRNPGINFVVDQDDAIFLSIRHLLNGKSHSKSIPVEIKMAPDNCLRAFIHGFFMGDGHKRKNSITKTLYTSSEQLANDLQEIILKAGLVANISVRDRRRKSLTICGKNTKANYPEFTVTLISPKKYSPVLRVDKKCTNHLRGWYKKQYDGNVYCVEMPLVPVYVRRKGKAFWCYRTFPELRSTTIKTVHDWLPPRLFGDYRETKHEYVIRNLPMADGTKVEIELIYIALDDAADVAKLLSLELTGAWLNEVREIPRIIFDTIQSRCGRFPAIKDGGCTWYGVIADTNAPDEDHWLVKLEQQIHTDPEVAKFYSVYRQPSGISEEAENIPNLPKDYYQNMMVGKEKEWIDVYVHGKNGYLRDGKPVYMNYNDTLHTSPTIIEPVKSVPLILGFDFGLNATCVIGQYLPMGRLNILDEFVGEDIAIRRLLVEVVKPVLNTKYRNHELIVTADPSGNKRSDTDEKSCYQELREAGLRVTNPAPSNAWMPRFMAVDTLLTRMLGDGKPALQLSPNCEILRRGFISKYRRKKIGLVGREMFREVAEKSIESHPHDCVQYIAMTSENTNRVLTRREQRRRVSSPDKKTSMNAWL